MPAMGLLLVCCLSLGVQVGVGGDGSLWLWRHLHFPYSSLGISGMDVRRQQQWFCVYPTVSGILSPMNGASDLEVAQKLLRQLIDALQIVEQCQTAPVILSDPLAVSSLWEVLLMDGPS